MSIPILIIAFFLLTLSSSTPACYSTCLSDTSCTAYGLDLCSSCRSDMLLDPLNNICKGISGISLVDTVNYTWTNSDTTYVTAVKNKSSFNLYVSMADLQTAIGDTSSVFPELMDSDMLIYVLQGMPAHYKITLLINYQSSPPGGCTSANFSIYYQQPNIFTFNQLTYVQTSSLPPTTTTIYDLYTTTTTQQIGIQYHTTATSCTHLNIYDITFVIMLCPQYCLQCSSINVCNKCGKDQLYQQTYWNIFMASCTLTCLNSYLNDVLNAIYQCDTCNPACSVCTGYSASECTTCNSLSGYNLALGSTTQCIQGCPISQFIQGSPKQCAACNPSCLQCRNIPSNCTRCGLDTNSQQQYLDTTNHICVLICSLSYLSMTATQTYECDKCHLSCITCTGQSVSDCTSCNNDQGYYMYNGTTQCIFGCPASTHIIGGTPLVCSPCLSPCKTCHTLANNCTSCSKAIGTDPQYYYDNVQQQMCIINCSLNYFHDDLLQQYTCNVCQVSCYQCNSTACVQCRNSQGYYWLSSTNRTCVLGCPPGQNPIGTPLTCGSCDPSCLACQGTTTNCTSCDPNLILFNQTCLTSCPDGYYLNATTCLPCADGCLTCTGPTLKHCLACTNHSNGTAYYKYATATTCNYTCPKGQYQSNVSEHKCFTCLSFCSTCAIAASYCTTCNNSNGYYLSNDSSSCTACPIGQTAILNTNSILQCTACSSSCLNCSLTITNCTSCPTTTNLYNHTCIAQCPGSYTAVNQICTLCQYYVFSSQCVQECPSGYQPRNNSDAVMQCSVCGENGCNVNSVFTVQTKVVNQGRQYQHQLYLPLGIGTSSTQDKLLNGVTVTISSTSQRRLLASTVTLTVHSLSITSINTITIITSYHPASISTSTVSVAFTSGTLVTASGTTYTSLRSSLALNNPIFKQSYYQAFYQSDNEQGEGIAFVLLSFICVFVVGIGIREKRVQHQCVAFVFMVQIVGLMRLRNIGDEQFQYYNTLKGYSYYQLQFIPNAFTDAFARNQYTQTVINPALFVYGFQNFFLCFGQLLYTYLPLQFLAFLAYLILKHKQYDLSWINSIQQFIFIIWSNIIIFGILLCLLSIQNNKITSQTPGYAITFFLSLLFLLPYGIYFFYVVRRQLHLQLYKYNNIIRIICILMIAYGYQMGFVFLNITEVMFIAVEMSIYRSYKINCWIYLGERVMFSIAMNCVMVQLQYKALLVVLALVFGCVFGIKVYYIIIAAIQHCKINKDNKEDQLVSYQNQSMNELQSNKIKKNSIQQPITSKINQHQVQLLQDSPINNTKINQSNPFNTINEPEKGQSPFLVDQKQINDININNPSQYQLAAIDIEENNQEQFENQVRKVVKRRKKRLEPIVLSNNFTQKEPIEEIAIDKSSSVSKNQVIQDIEESREEEEEQTWK